MNINTHPVVNGKAKIGEDTLDLPAEAVGKLTAEDKGQIVVGFRPEDADLAASTDANAFSLKVVNVEDLGSDHYLFVEIGSDEPVIVRSPGKATIEVGAKVSLAPQAGHLYRFDADGKPVR